MLDFYISPNLHWSSTGEMLSNNNDLAVHILTSVLVDLGSTAPDNYSTTITRENRVVLLDIGSGLRYYEIPVSYFDKIKFEGEHLYRSTNATTTIYRCFVKLRGEI